MDFITTAKRRKLVAALPAAYQSGKEACLLVSLVLRFSFMNTCITFPPLKATMIDKIKGTEKRRPKHSHAVSACGSLEITAAECIQWLI